MTFLATYPNPATLWCEDMLLTLGVKESDCIERGEAFLYLYLWKNLQLAQFELWLTFVCTLQLAHTCEKTCNLHNLSCDRLFSWENWNVGSQYLGAAASIIWSYGARQKYITFKLEKCSRIYFGFGQWWRIYLNKNFIKK